MSAFDQSESFSLLEKLLLVHFLGLLLGSSWLFGGNIWWMREIQIGRAHV